MVKNLPVNARDSGSISGLGQCPGEGNGNPLQCSCLESSMDRGAWWAKSVGSQSVGHDGMTNIFTLSHIVRNKCVSNTHTDSHTFACVFLFTLTTLNLNLKHL